MHARTITLPDYASWRFEGNINANALVIGDVDNDDEHELVIANIHGRLAVFKYLTGNGTMPRRGDFWEESDDDLDDDLAAIDDDEFFLRYDHVIVGEPWLAMDGLGSVTSLVVGDLGTTGVNSIVTVSAEGTLSVIDVVTTQQKSSLVLRFQIPAPLNVCRMLIADLDGDGRNELVLARTDRQVSVFAVHVPAALLASSRPASQPETPRLGPGPPPGGAAIAVSKASSIASIPGAMIAPSASVSAGPGTTTATTTATVTTVPSPLLVPSGAGTLRGRRRTLTSPAPPPLADLLAAAAAVPLPTTRPSTAGGHATPVPTLEMRATFPFAGQIGSLGLVADPEGVDDAPWLLVAQPAGKVEVVLPTGERHVWPVAAPTVPAAAAVHGAGAVDSAGKPTTTKPGENRYLQQMNEAMSFLPIRYATDTIDATPAVSTPALPTKSTATTIAQVATELVTLPSGHVAAITSDGTVTFYTRDAGDAAARSDLQVNHQLFAAGWIPTAAGAAVVACAHDGTTYLVDATLDAVQVVARNRVAGFVAGPLAVAPGVHRVCLVYVNFENRVEVVHADVARLGRNGMRLRDAGEVAPGVGREEIAAALYG
ncbi:hypothetical protein AMAG_17554 [Allomyces macrogynus ATCC 38327]|uniref:Uncharacterized protein n=1 Tax=Allomyces macrogynus (strain ATCC 38327) TaxID=578462 RepID=A0A0L0TFE7_ALLM3|nr:hypothetical protein AMAG_17554 [Allomyces macrogynus ATCC 38327]|eukprot:KNE73329.1 hypothetical protein AMAG_17554 [Allomyces macrogynus ATCC 38327]